MAELNAKSQVLLLNFNYRSELLQKSQTLYFEIGYFKTKNIFFNHIKIKSQENEFPF